MTDKELFQNQFVALAGNIGCGKTTAAKLISSRLGYELFEEPVIDNRFLARYYADMSRWSFTLQLEFLLKRIDHHDIISRVPKHCIQDRSLVEDPEIFAKYLHGLGHMADEELDLYLDYFERLNRGVRQPDRVICFQCSDVNVLLKRIRIRGRKEEQAIDPHFLEGLNGYYAALPQILRKKYNVPVMVVDVSHFNIHDTAEAAGFILNVERFLKTGETSAANQQPARSNPNNSSTTTQTSAQF